VAKKVRIQVLDMSRANPEEIMDLKETLYAIMDEAFELACRELDRGHLYGCLHSHIEICMKKTAADSPCELCDVAKVPDGETMH
jgi:hypothetical protein